MVCPKCGSKKLCVTNSRLAKRNNQVWRRRKCTTCQLCMTTREAIDLSSIFCVKKRSGKIEPYMRSKLLISVIRSLDHTPANLDAAYSLTDTIESRLFGNLEDSVMTSEIVAETALKALKNFDAPAYVKYLSYLEHLDKRTLINRLAQNKQT